jgi:hypothetical protein
MEAGGGGLGGLCWEDWWRASVHRDGILAEEALAGSCVGNQSSRAKDSLLGHARVSLLGHAISVVG